MQSRKPSRRNAKNTRIPITERLVMRVKEDLLSLGVKGGMRRLREVEPALHRAVHIRAGEAVASLTHLELDKDGYGEITNTIEWTSLVLAESMRRSHRAAPMAGASAQQIPKSRQRGAVSEVGSQEGTSTEVHAHTVRLHGALRPTPGKGHDMSLVGFTLERGPGVLDYIAVSPDEAMKIVQVLIELLLEGNCDEARKRWGADATPHAGNGARPRQSDPKSTGRSATTKAPRRVSHASDGLVDREALDLMQSQVRAVGVQKKKEELAQVEPAIVAFFDECLFSAYGSFRDPDNPEFPDMKVFTDLNVLMLSIIETLRKSHYVLWEDLMEGTLISQTDPSLNDPNRCQRRVQ
jgi:hypothetical protein